MAGQLATSVCSKPSEFLPRSTSEAAPGAMGGVVGSMRSASVSRPLPRQMSISMSSSIFPIPWSTSSPRADRSPGASASWWSISRAKGQLPRPLVERGPGRGAPGRGGEDVAPSAAGNASAALSVSWRRGSPGLLLAPPPLRRPAGVGGELDAVSTDEVLHRPCALAQLCLSAFDRLEARRGSGASTPSMQASASLWRPAWFLSDGAEWKRITFSRAPVSSSWRSGHGEDVRWRSRR